MLYLDDDSGDHRLVKHLLEANIAVVTTVDVELRGMPDPVHYEAARQRGYRVVTRNRADFVALFDDDEGTHPGVLVWNRTNNVKTDLNWLSVGRVLVAIHQPENHDVAPFGAVLDLDKYRYLLSASAVAPDAPDDE